MPGNRHWIVGRPVADAVDGQHDDAHAQYGDDDERGDHEYGDVDAQQCERRSACERDTRYRVTGHYSVVLFSTVARECSVYVRRRCTRSEDPD